MSPRRLLTMGVLIVAISSLAISSAAGNGYSVTVDDSIETPEREITVDNETHVVSEISDIEPGNDFTAKVSVPDSHSYRIEIWGMKDESWRRMENTFVDSSDDDTHTFDTTHYWEGSYVLAVRNASNHSIEAIHPIIVSGCDVAIQMPASIDAGESVNGTVTIYETSDSTEVQKVEVVVLNGSRSVSTEASKTSEGEYAATVDLSGWSPGTYKVYAMVQNSSKTPNGQYEPIGMSAPNTIEISEKTDTTTTTTSNDGNNGGENNGGSETTTTTTATPTTTTTTKNSTSTITQTDTPSSTTTPTTSTPTKTTQGNTSTPTETESSTPTQTTTENVISPNTTTSSPETTTEGTTHGFTVLIAIFGLLAAVLLTKRRR